MASASSSLTSAVRRELIAFGVLLFIGIVVVPIAAYSAGMAFFASYDGGDGSLGNYLRRYYVDAFSLRGGLWFVTLAPWLVWLCLRLAYWGLRGRKLPPKSERSAT